MENVMTNGFTELSNEETLEFNGGWSASECMSGVGLVGAALIGGAAAVACGPAIVAAGTGVMIGTFAGCMMSSFAGGYLIGDSFWN